LAALQVGLSEASSASPNFRFAARIVFEPQLKGDSVVALYLSDLKAHTPLRLASVLLKFFFFSHPLSKAMLERLSCLPQMHGYFFLFLP